MATVTLGSTLPFDLDLNITNIVGGGSATVFGNRPWGKDGKPAAYQPYATTQVDAGLWEAWNAQYSNPSFVAVRTGAIFVVA